MNLLNWFDELDPTRKEQVASRSRAHCHARGVHSIVIDENPNNGKLTRLFVATKDHELYKNLIGYYTQGLSVGFHPHHSDIDIQSLHGTIFNWEIVVGEEVYTERHRRLGVYEYTSPIKNEQGKFVKNGLTNWETDCLYRVKPKQLIFLHADTLHTIGVEYNQIAAWLVYEKASNPDYRPLCYSNTELESASFDGMYLPMTVQDVEETLKLIS